MMNLNRNPYYDDYSESKEFYKIVYVPGYAVQARELTQQQDILQTQVKRIGDHLFQNGAMVKPGQAAVNVKANFVRLSSTYNSFPIDITQFAGQTIIGTTTGMVANVVATVAGTSQAAPTLYVTYSNSGTDGKTKAFAAGEPLLIKGTVNPLASVISDSSPSTGIGATAQIQDGVYYVNGYFCLVNQQYIVLTGGTLASPTSYAYAPAGVNATPVDARVGLKIVESLITSADDASLNDNAQGSPNYAAPGNHRYKIDLVLTSKAIDDFSDPGFIELVRLKEGVKQQLVNKTQYDVLADELARRTADTNGDFTVRPFGIDIHEHLDTSFVTSGLARGATAALGAVQAIGARATANIVGGKILSFTILDGGSGYTSVPAVTVLDSGGGSGVSAAAIVTGGVVTSIIINTDSFHNPINGSGYTSATAVNIAPAIPYSAAQNAKIVLSASASSMDGAYVSDKLYISDGSGAGTMRLITAYSGATKTAAVDSDWDLLNVPDATSTYIITDVSAVNGGIYPPPTGNEAKLAVGLEAGKAYVDGYEIRSLVTTYIDVDKARDAKVAPNAVVPANVGNYILVKGLFNFPLPAGTSVPVDYPIISLLNSVSTGSLSTPNIIGTARVRNVEFFSGTSTSDPTAIFALYLFDVSMGQYDINYAKSFFCVSDQIGNSQNSYGNICTQFNITNLNGSAPVPGDVISQANTNTEKVISFDTATNVMLTEPLTGGQVSPGFFALDSTNNASFQVASRTQLFDTADNALLFPLALPIIKTLRDAGGNYNTSYAVRRTFTATSSSSSTYVFNAAANETFLWSNDAVVVVVACTNSSYVGKFISAYSVSGSGTSTLTLTINSLPANGNTTIKLCCQVVKNVTEPKSKTLVTNQTVVYTMPTNIMSLYTADAYRLVSVIDSGDIAVLPSATNSKNINITSRYTLDNGQRDNYYDIASITLNNNVPAPTGQIAITFDYFTHGPNSSGDYFCVDSYDPTQVPYESIPTYVSASGQNYPLRDYLDFRPRVSNSGGLNIIPAVAVAVAGASATATISGGQIATITLNSGGMGYSGTPSISFVGGGGANAAAVATVNSGVVTNITINNHGNGYTSAPTVVFNANAGVTESVTTVNVISPGSGYGANAPQVVFTGGGGSGAAATATVVNGSVSGIVMTNHGSGYTTTPTVTLVPVFNSSFNAAGSSFSELVNPYSQVTTTFQYYLARIDKIYLDKTGVFHVIRGTPSLNPVPPADPKDGMMLYTLTLNPYTFSPKDTKSVMTDNKGYTMRMIGDLERRIVHLEYYTLLNQLESDTQNMSITDTSTGIDRFKNGFVVDNFKGTSVANVFDGDFHAAIDINAGNMRPVFKQDCLNFEFDASNSGNYQQTGDLITLPYTSVEWIKQSQATRIENVNPFAVFGWAGDLTLVPPADVWKDTVQRPDILVNDDSALDGVKFGPDPAGVIWGDWVTTWTGQPTTTTTIPTSQGRAGTVPLASFGKNVGYTDLNTFYWLKPDGTQGTSAFGDYAPQAKGWILEGRLGKVQQDQIVTTSQQLKQSRTGLQNVTIPTVASQTINNQVVSINMIPYMRSIVVQFTGRLMKPNTRVYPFFDNTAVSLYIRPTQTAETPTLKNGTWNDPLYTNGVGTVTGEFRIPNDATLSFRVGSRVLRLSSDAYNGPNADTWADATFTAAGVLETNQATITSVRVPETITQTVSQTQTITQSQQTTQTVIISGYVDPVAETFLVDLSGGVFLTKVDIFFESKDANIPVTLEIRNVVNGYPGQQVVPFSRVSLYPTINSIGISNNAAAPTTFTFPSPVYLNEGTEYALVIMANSVQYHVFTAYMGETIIGGTGIVSQQPYAGVMFLSQNASTWTAVQEEDLKFTIYRAKFDTTTTSQCFFVNPDIEDEVLGALPFKTMRGSGLVRTYHQNHDLPSINSVARLTIPAISAPGTANPYLYNGIDFSGGNWVNGALVSPTNTTSFIPVYNISDAVASVIISNGSVAGFHITDGGSGYAVAPTVVISAPNISGIQATATCNIVNGVITSITLTNAGSGYTSATVSFTPDRTNLVGFQGEFSIQNVDLDTYCVDIPGQTADTTGFTGPLGVYAAHNRQYATIHPIFGIQVPPGTESDWSVKTLSGKSPHAEVGTQTPYVLDTTWTDITVNNDHDFTTPRLIADYLNESHNGINKSLTLQCNMSTTVDNLSPVIDTTRMGVILVNSRIDNPTFANLTVLDGITPSNTIMDIDTIITSGATNTVNFVTNNGVNQIVQSGTQGLDFSVFSIGKYVQITGSSQLVNNYAFPSTVLITDVTSTSLTLDLGINGSGNPNVFVNTTNETGVQITQYGRYVSEIAPFNCSTASRYITRQFTLADPANSLHLYLTVMRPSSAFVDAYYRVQYVDTIGDFNSLPYTKMALDASVDNAPAQNNQDFKDYVFTAEDIGKFISFSIKIVMRGGNSAAVPLSQALRGIALAT